LKQMTQVSRYPY